MNFGAWEAVKRLSAAKLKVVIQHAFTNMSTEHAHCGFLRANEVPMSDPQANVNSEHLLWQELHRGPAVLANRIGASQPTEGMTRIAFAEQYDDASPVIFRTAAVMTSWHAYQLWKILGGLLPIEEFQRYESGFEEQPSVDAEV